MAVQTDEPSRRKRSRGFPTLDLERSVDAIRTAGQYGLAHSRDAFASYLGHQSSDSGPFRQKLAALRDFALVETGSEIVLTPLGARLALPNSDDEERRDRVEAFFSSDVFEALFEKSAKGLALDEDRLAASGVHNHGIAPASRRAFAESFVASALYAGLASRGASGGVILEPVEPLRPSTSPVTQGAPPVLKEDPAPTLSSPAVFQTDLTFSHQIGDGEATFTLRLEQALPASLFARVQDVASAIEQLAVEAQLGSSTGRSTANNRGNDHEGVEPAGRGDSISLHRTMDPTLDAVDSLE